MPIYCYTHCVRTWDSVRKIDDRHNELCPECGETAEILITAGARPVVYDYYDNGLGERVTGPAHRRRLMKQKDLED